MFNIPECCRPANWPNFCFPRGVHTDDDELTKCVWLLLPLFIPVAAARLQWPLVVAFIRVLHVLTCIMLEVTERGLVWQKQLFNKRTGYDFIFHIPAVSLITFSSAAHVFVCFRKEWDTCLVAVDHPDSSSVPQSWVLPNPPSDQAWASALQTTDTDCENL